MAAPKGNQFWLARSSHGAKPKFSDHNVLLAASLEYMQWCVDNPLYETKAFHFQGGVTLEELPKMRAMTINGLCIFLDISQDTLANYAKKSKDFLAVISKIKEMIYEQKFTGAAADLLNANIIARDLGLKDQSTPVAVTVNNNNTVVDDKTLKDRGIPVPDVGEDNDIDD